MSKQVTWFIKYLAAAMSRHVSLSTAFKPDVVDIPGVLQNLKNSQRFESMAIGQPPEGDTGQQQDVSHWCDAARRDSLT